MQDASFFLRWLEHANYERLKTCKKPTTQNGDLMLIYINEPW